MFNPVTMAVEPADKWHTVEAGKNSVEYRWVIAGTEAYISDFSKRFVPFKLALNKAYPNPSRGRVSILFTIPYSGLNGLNFAIYDLAGRKIWEHSPTGPLLPGAHTIQWNGRSGNGALASSGVYVLRMTARSSGSKSPQVFKTRLMRVR
jgi:hypothetical protein